MTDVIDPKEENEDIIEIVPVGKRPKVRLDYLDIAKGLAILLVVIGHVPDSFDAPLYRVAVYTFHMPLFFMVSEAVTKRLPIPFSGFCPAYSAPVSSWN